MLKILSCGSGVQSSTAVEMVWTGELECPDYIIFADPGWETPATYEHTAYLERGSLLRGIPFIRVSAGNIREDCTRGARSAPLGQRNVSMPFFTKDMETGQIGIVRRQCTDEYKIAPINRKVRELLGFKPRQRLPIGAVEMWICITTDELSRVSVSRDRWRVNRYPFVEKRMSRNDCVVWSAQKGFPDAPRSACIGCPFRSNHEWRNIKADPILWADAVEFDSLIRRKGGVRGDLFLHRSCKPLSEVDLSTSEDRGQLSLSMFRTDCKGMCGV